MAVSAVIFDWGGTLTPFSDVDLLDLWRTAGEVYAPERADELAAALREAEAGWWVEAVASGSSGTTADIVARASAATGLDLDAALHDRALEAYLDAWTPHTVAHPQAAPLLVALRERGVRTGLLSNTHWPRSWHEHWLQRDGILDLLDARVYTSDLAHLKPHPEAFRAALDATAAGVPLAPDEVVFVGDRPVDDISGAAAVGMRTILITSSLRGARPVPDSPVEPDARISALAEVLGVVDRWRGEPQGRHHRHVATRVQEQTADAELAARLRVAVGRLQRQLRRRAFGDLTLSQISALVSLEQHGPLRAGDLAARESVSAPTMTRILAVLEERGLVAREVDPADRRASSVVLTGQGSTVLATLRRERTAFLADRLAQLNTDGRRRLADAVDVLEQLVALPEP